MCKDVEESRLKIHDWPLLSREPSVRVSPVWMNHDESDLWIRVVDLCPNPSLVNAPDGGAAMPSSIDEIVGI